MGCLNLPKNKPIENLHISICKQLIGVHKNTTNIGVLLEVGSVPLTLYATNIGVLLEVGRVPLTLYATNIGVRLEVGRAPLTLYATNIGVRLEVGRVPLTLYATNIGVLLEVGRVPLTLYATNIGVLLEVGRVPLTLYATNIGVRLEVGRVPLTLYATNIGVCLEVGRVPLTLYATNIGVLLEVGRVPLTLYARKLAIQNWERIRKNKANSLIIESYKESLKEKLPWVIHIKKLLEENGMLTFFINPYEDKPCFVNKRIFQTLSDAFHQNALECIRDEGSKLRTYATFKNNTYLRLKIQKLEYKYQNLGSRTIS